MGYWNQHLGRMDGKVHQHKLHAAMQGYIFNFSGHFQTIPDISVIAARAWFYLMPAKRDSIGGPACN